MILFINLRIAEFVGNLNIAIFGKTIEFELAFVDL